MVGFWRKSFSGLWTADFPLCPDMVEELWDLWSLFYKDTNLIQEGSNLMT